MQDLLASASRPSSNILASIVGLVMLLVGATSVFAELQSDLDRIWRAPALPQISSMISLLRSRLLSFGMVIAMGFLLLVSLVIGAALSALGQWGGTMIAESADMLQVLNTVVTFGITTLLFATAYRILPRVRIAWTDVWMGAVVTAILFTLGKYLIGLYIGRAGVSSSFGAAGSLIIVLVWVYYSAQIFLLGAEFTWVFAHRHGSRVGVPPVERRHRGAAPGAVLITASFSNLFEQPGSRLIAGTERDEAGGEIHGADEVAALAHVGHQRGEHLPVAGMCAPGPVQQGNRVGQASARVQRHRVGVLGIGVIRRKLGGALQFDERAGEILPPDEQQAERVMQIGRLWRERQGVAKHALAFGIPIRGSIEIGQVHRRRREVRLELARRQVLGFRADSHRHVPHSRPPG